MTSDLPALSSREILRVLRRDGWTVDRHEGNHIIVMRPDGNGRVIVPNHPGSLPPGTLRGILQQAGLSRDAFHQLRRRRN